MKPADTFHSATMKAYLRFEDGPAGCDFACSGRAAESVRVRLPLIPNDYAVKPVEHHGVTLQALLLSTECNS